MDKKKYTTDENGIQELADFYISHAKVDYYSICPEDGISVIFLAGAQGSGKTEFVETVLDLHSFFVIDIDKYRCCFEGYNGENASEYQEAAVRVADKIFSFCIKNGINTIFDGTFRSFSKVKQNLEFCKKYLRNVAIFYIFQDPIISFNYTFIRKIEKSRNVPIDVFVDGFYESIKNIFYAKENYKNIDLYICIKRLGKGNKINFHIRNNLVNIENFCNSFNIGYNNGVFTNLSSLKARLQFYEKILKVKYFLKKLFTR